MPWYHASPYYTRQVNVTNVNITYIHNTTVANNYNNFITNTRTVNNVNQLNTNNIQYANRAQVTAVPANAMSSGRPVAQAAVKLTPAMRQQLSAAPVHYAPSAPAPTQPLLAAEAEREGACRGADAGDAARLGEGYANGHPRPACPCQPAQATTPAALPKPAAGAVAGRPATAQPAAAKGCR